MKSLAIGIAAGLSLLANAAFADEPELDLGTHVRRVCAASKADNLENLRQAKADLAQFERMNERDRAQGFYPEVRETLIGHLEDLDTLDGLITAETRRAIEDAMLGYWLAEEEIAELALDNTDIDFQALRSLHDDVKREIEALLNEDFREVREGLAFENGVLMYRGQETPWSLHMYLEDGKDILMLHLKDNPEFYRTDYENATMKMEYWPLSGEVTIGHDDQYMSQDYQRVPLAEKVSLREIIDYGIENFLNKVGDELANAFIASTDFDLTVQRLQERVDVYTERYEAEAADCGRAERAFRP